jgi:hypothetical protein
MLEDTQGYMTIPDYSGAGKWKDVLNVDPIYIDRASGGMDGNLDFIHRMNDIIKRTRKLGLTIEKYF